MEFVRAYLGIYDLPKPAPFRASGRQTCLENVSAILKAGGTSMERVMSAIVILLEETDFAGMNEEWIKWFPANPPARQGAKLPVRIPGLRVSIAAIAEA